MGRHLRTSDGRFLGRLCTDPNCDGSLVADTALAWLGGPQTPIYRCDGLTHIDDTTPLTACKVEHPRLEPRP